MPEYKLRKKTFYDYRLAIAWIAYIAYTYPDSFESSQSPEGFNLSHHFYNSGTDTQGIMGSLDDDHVIAFRGTTNIKDVFTDLMSFKQEIPYSSMDAMSPIKVHTGFLRAYESVRKEITFSILDQIEQGEITPNNLIFTGHSLGAALATLGALDAQYHADKRELDIGILCMTFGSPRVGNHEFVKSYMNRVVFTLRFVNDKDIITHLPPETLGFSHIFPPSVIGVDDPGVLSELALDHQMLEYVKGLS